MKNLDESITNLGNLDESMSNAIGFKDLFSKEGIRGALFLGPAGAIIEANKKLKQKEKALAAAEGAEKEIAKAELEAANIALAQAQAELDASKNSGSSSSSGNRVNETEAKKFPWLLVGGITFGVLALATTAYFVFRKK
jgi:hypothetical protein